MDGAYWSRWPPHLVAGRTAVPRAALRRRRYQVGFWLSGRAAERSPVTGRTYIWLNDLPIARAPYWLLPLISPLPAIPLRSPTRPWRPSMGDMLVNFVANAVEGNRNKALYWAARKAMAEGSIGRIHDELVNAAVAAGESPAAAEATVKSAMKAVQ